MFKAQEDSNRIRISPSCLTSVNYNYSTLATRGKQGTVANKSPYSYTENVYD